MKGLHSRVARAKLAFLVLLLFGVFALSPARSAPAGEKVRLAVPVVAVQYAPIYLGIREGLFTSEGLEVEIHVTRTDLAMTALYNGRLDYIAHGGAALRGAVRGFPIKLIFALDDKAPFWLFVQPDIVNVSLLKNKSVGVSFPGDTPHLVLKRFLRRRGLDPEKDVAYVAGQFSPIGFQGLLARVLDGAVLAPPYSVLAEEKGLRLLAFLGEEVPDAPTISGIVTSDRQIREQRDQAKRLIRAMVKSVNLYRHSKELAKNFLASKFNLHKTAAAKVYRDAVRMLTADGEVSPDKIRDVLNLGRESGQAMSALQGPEEVVDFSFLRQIRRDAGAFSASGAAQKRP